MLTTFAPASKISQSSSGHDSRRQVTQLIRELQPDVVLTASPDDYLCDHEATSQLVRDACFTAPIPNYSASGNAAHIPSIPHLYYLDPIELIGRSGKPVLPDFTIDVSTTFEIKKQMLAKHETQRDWLRQQHRIDDYLVKMEQWIERAAPVPESRSAKVFANIAFIRTRKARFCRNASRPISSPSVRSGPRRRRRYIPDVY